MVGSFLPTTLVVLLMIEATHMIGDSLFVFGEILRARRR